MRRVWLILFAFLLPLQAVWAASHGYAHDAKTEVHALAEAAGADEHTSNDAKSRCCCDMAHGCHGSPQLVSSLVQAPDTDARNFLNASSPALTSRMVVSRHERPQWSAA